MEDIYIMLLPVIKETIIEHKTSPYPSHIFLYFYILQLVCLLRVISTPSSLVWNCYTPL